MAMLLAGNVMKLMIQLFASSAETEYWNGMKIVMTVISLTTRDVIHCVLELSLTGLAILELIKQNASYVEMDL